MAKAILLCIFTFATIHDVSAADGENQKIVVELKPVVEQSDALEELIARALSVFQTDGFGNEWLPTSVSTGQWSTITFQNGHFGIRVFTEAEKNQLRDSLPKDLRTSDMFQVMEVRSSFIRIKSNELELTIPATRINFIARGISGDLPN